MLERVGGASEGLGPQGGHVTGEEAAGRVGARLCALLVLAPSTEHFCELFRKFMGTRQLAFYSLFLRCFVKLDAELTLFLRLLFKLPSFAAATHLPMFT